MLLSPLVIVKSHRTPPLVFPAGTVMVSEIYRIYRYLCVTLRWNFCWHVCVPVSRIHIYVCMCAVCICIDDKVLRVTLKVLPNLTILSKLARLRIPIQCAAIDE